MNKVTLIDPLTDPRWDQFVINHPHGCIGHTSAWKKVLENSFSHMKGYYYAIENQNSEQIKAALPIFMVKSWLTGNRMVSVPFATLCDPLIADNQDISALLHVVIEKTRREKCKTIEIRSHTTHQMLQECDLTISSEYVTHQIDLNQSVDDIYKSFHRKTVRQSIRRAEKQDLRITTGNKSKDIDPFYLLYSDTRRRLGLPSHPVSYFKEMWKQLHPLGNMILMFAYTNNTPISAVICLKYKNRISAEYNGWDRRFAKLCPNHHLYWEIMKYAKASGYNAFDFGRTHKSNRHLMEFKDRWGAKKENLFNYYNDTAARNHSDRESSLKYVVVNTLCKRLPDSGFRLLSKFCYRHLG